MDRIVEKDNQQLIYSADEDIYYWQEAFGSWKVSQSFRDIPEAMKAFNSSKLRYL